MLRKYSVLLGISMSLLLLFIATRFYPGGSQDNPNSIGFDWANNYLCNLFNEQAVNGSPNTSRLWAMAGMLFLCVSTALFFLEFPAKIPAKREANIIRYAGVSAMIAGFFIATPYHDIMITISSTLGLLSMFYIIVFTVKSRLTAIKIFSIIALLSFYACNYMYYSRSLLSFLPIMQKINLTLTIIWVLWLQYFTTKEDFQGIRMSKKKNKNSTERT